MKVRFLGDSFPAAREILAELLAEDDVGAWASGAPAGPDGRADVLVPAMREVDGSLMDAARPALIQQFGAGLEGVDVAAAAARGIPVANVPADRTGNAGSVAELAMLHLLALSRRFDQARAALRDGRLGEPLGRGLGGQTATVIGLGAIGREVLTRLRPFGTRLVGMGRRPRSEADPTVLALVDEYRPLVQLHAALTATDLLVLCLPLTGDKRGIIGAAELRALRPGGILVNVGRGPVVDHDALVAALRSGSLTAAGLDVYWQEPIDPDDPVLAENVSATPHVGGVTTQAYRATAERFAANVERLRRGAPLEDRAA
ncbi:NAD(P)-dependent oxidoreductase [Rugosimonospora africana]|uniref:Glyoxylate reductase n=1 Tax=Rugosimonospora africana TaxID=556532 RepID=A0A8J3VV53_9ACTN|nr:NAD(P)-dependent oxidoreductase [Rugosimonospora africana]GIH19930.1 glyoxylate reductase [Rugosimonospora africana]